MERFGMDEWMDCIVFIVFVLSYMFGSDDPSMHACILFDTTTSWKDDTDTSTIERLLFSDQTSTSTAIHKAFSKITLAKLLLFANDESCHDYIDQESQFRNLWQNRDSHYDFHVQFHMDGLLPKILAVHHSLAGPGLARSLWFYVFTCFGMTVPYRIWFSRHCTNVEVTVTKEVTGWEYGL